MNKNKKKPLICMMCPSLDGGWGRVLINLANYFTMLGLDVHFCVDDLSGTFAAELDPGTKVHLLRSTHQIGGIPYLSKYILKHKPDIIVTTVVRHTVLAVRVCNLARVPARIFPTIHNTYGVTFKELSNAKSHSRLKAMRKYYSRCEGVVAVSEGVREDFIAISEIHPEKVTRIYNPIYDDEMLRRSEEPLHHPWFQTGEPPVILGAGRLVKQKNFELLIRSFNLLRQTKECRLVIIGEGDKRKHLEVEANNSPYADDISLIGFEENPFPFMKRAGLFVLSSSWEGFGNVLVESMATGTPVVSTDCPNGPSEILMGGQFGTLVPLDDAQKMAIAMADTLENPLPAEILVNRAAEYSVSSSAEGYLRLFGISM